MAKQIIIPDESTRPKAPDFGPLSEQEKQPMRHLRAIHEHHRRNMRMMRTLLEGVRKGDTSASEFHAQIKDNPIFQNYQIFGNLCGQHCQMVNGHHQIEDMHIFPALEGRKAALDKVIKRLREEHEVVHALLVQLSDEAAKLIDDPSDAQFERTVEAHEKLETLLLSHFGYEEDEVGPALGHYNLPV